MAGRGFGQNLGMSGQVRAASAQIKRVGRWSRPALLLAGGGAAGFGVAVFSGVNADFSQPLATLLAGTGVLVAGILAYVNGQRTRDQAEEHHNEEMARERERHADDTERAREAALWERFGAAAAQLADKSAAIRIAGVYAMAGVADERSGANRQQCIDVLCGYLRLPYDPAQGGSGRTKLVTKTVVSRDEVEQEEHTEYRQNDREVRATIVRVIADHLKPDTDYSWSTSDFDLRTAHLENIDLKGVTFSGDARFEGVTFSGKATFDNATFSSRTFFSGATFCGDAIFTGARLGGPPFGGVGFDDATFYGDAIFTAATFPGYACYEAASFRSDVRFIGATFCRSATFKSATFSGKAEFGGATFSGKAEFGGVTFSGNTSFCAPIVAGATFCDEVMFNGATFEGNTRFDRVNFGNGAISFVDPNQWGPPAPVFDWDRDISQKPPNVNPQDWPPAVVPTS